MIPRRPIEEGNRVRIRVQAVGQGLLKKGVEVISREMQLWEASFLLQNVGCPLLGPQKNHLCGENGVREGAMAKIQDLEGLLHIVCLQQKNQTHV